MPSPKCHIEQDDPYAWLKDQLDQRLPKGTIIIGVDIDTWPGTIPSDDAD